MRTPSLGLAPEGGPIIGLLALTALVFACLDWWLPALLALLLLWLAVHFFRNPERVVPHGENLAVSPADGKVIRIANRADPLSGEARVCVSVFMNIFSVHINRSPVAGRVTDIAYTPGKFFNAAWDKASTDNERCAWQVTDADGATWTFVQIAGLVARRIVPWAEVGDDLTRGERFGLIRFGSRVDLYLPAGYDSAVNIGQTVLAGQTVIARRSPCDGKD